MLYFGRVEESSLLVYYIARRLEDKRSLIKSLMAVPTSIKKSYEAYIGDI